MKRFSSIISCLLIIAILVSSSVTPAYAVQNPTTGDFWKWLVEGASSETGSSDVNFSKYLQSVFSTKDSGCTKSSSGYHSWTCVPDPVSMVINKFRVKCAFCGMYYSDYSSCDPEKEAESAYTDYVSTLPAGGYDSAGTLLWQPRWVEDSSLYQIYATYNGATVIGDSKGGGTYQSKVTRTDSEGKEHVVLRNSYNGTSFAISISDPTGTGVFTIFDRYNRYRVPITGTYTLIGSDCVTGSYLNAKTGTFASVQVKWRSGSSWSRVAGGELANVYAQLSGTSSAIFGASTLSGSFKFSAPIFSVVPYEPESYSPTYNINTRVNNFNGDYYDSVTNNYYNNTTIVNETTNNYYDMTTNTTYVMQKWSYDYQSRTYFITLEDGTTVTVQFGDDCMTITNNNITNSYQYVIKNTPSTPDTPTTCKHEWTETIDTAPTCLESGHASYTCSKCGETYEHILAAKGHDWKVIEHVNMVYNADGTVATQGHTLYQCSVCGEQWYTDTGAPPPDVSGSSSILAWLTSFQMWLDGKLQLFVDKLQIVVDNSTTNVENVTNVVIEETNNAYNVFYVTTDDGDKKSIGEVSGDALSASGKLLNFLYKLCFENALSKVDDSITNMDGFYFDDAAGLEGSIWD